MNLIVDELKKGTSKENYAAQEKGHVACEQMRKKQRRKLRKERRKKY
jgi:hypothetical protein